MRMRRYPVLVLTCLAVAAVILLPRVVLPALSAPPRALPDLRMPRATEIDQGAMIVENSLMVLPAPPRAADELVQPAATLMSEGFEGVWPSPGWTVVDASAGDGGTYEWGKRNCRPRTGGFAGWSVGGGAHGGALPCSANYPNNARSLAVYGPIDLRYATSASLTFYFYGRTELDAGCQRDYLFVGASADRAQYYGVRLCGELLSGPSGNGYYEYTLSLQDWRGEPQVWLALDFSSNASVAYEGMMIDDMTLNVVFAPTPTASATTTPGPTLTPTATPGTTRTPTATPGATPTPVAKGYLPLIQKAGPTTATPTRSGASRPPG